MVTSVMMKSKAGKGEKKYQGLAKLSFILPGPVPSMFHTWWDERQGEEEQDGGGREPLHLA